MIFINYSIEEVKQCDIIIIAINHKEYLTFTKEEFNDKIVIDGWNILKENLYNNWRN
jgi:UDP-N-acetyl-D-mannosaminuronate dehydrogenase